MLYKTLNQEILDVCIRQGQYPTGWRIFHECPVCSSREIRPFFNKLKMNHDKCRDCDFVFLNPVPGEDILNRLYSGEYLTSVRKHISIPKALLGREDASTSMPLSIYENIILILTEKVQSGNWLDVGGGIGTFLQLVKKRHQLFECYLNEKNPESGEFARNHYGINVLSGSPLEIWETGLRFDVMSFNAVLEHVPDPKRFLSGYLRLLKPGGWLFINVPNYTRFNRWFSKQDSFNVIPPFHLNFFNRKNLKEMLLNFKEISDPLIWESGQAAFHLTDLVNDTENYDCVVPREKREAIETIQVQKLSLGKKIVTKIASRSNRIGTGLICKIDGGVYLNMAARVRTESELQNDMIHQQAIYPVSAEMDGTRAVNGRHQ